MIDIHTHLADKNSISAGFIEGISMSINFGDDVSLSQVKRILNLHLLDSNATNLMTQMDKAGMRNFRRSLKRYF